MAECVLGYIGSKTVTRDEVDDVVTKRFLLEGAVFALENCGALLRDAVTLYDLGSFPRSVVLAMFGREELGKYRILREAFETVANGGTVSRDAVLKDCRRHDRKQSRAVLSVVQRFHNTDPLGQAFQAMNQAEHGSPAWWAARRIIDESSDNLGQQLPGARHELRMRALYVNPCDDGNGWQRPQDQTPEEARHEVQDAISDYSLVYDGVVCGNEFHIPNAFLTDFQAWTHRPEILPPVRLKVPVA